MTTTFEIRPDFAPEGHIAQPSERTAKLQALLKAAQTKERWCVLQHWTEGSTIHCDIIFRTPDVWPPIPDDDPRRSRKYI